MQNFTYTNDQMRLERSLQDFMAQDEENEFTIKGYAGTGKTTVVVDIFAPYIGGKKEVVFSAPTNKAAKVIRDMAEKQDLAFSVATIHSLLGIRPGKDDELKRFEHNGVFNDLSDVLVVVIDEASQLNDALLKVIGQYRRRYPRVKWVYMGDPKQLRPVKQEYRSRVFDGVKRTLELTELVRFVAGSPTAKLSTHVRECSDLQEWPEFYDIPATEEYKGEVLVLSPSAWRNKLLEMVTDQAYEDRGDFCRAVAWRNVTVAGVNEMVRSAIYPGVTDPFCVGERVLTAGPVKDKREDVFIANTDDEFVVQEIIRRMEPIYGIEIWDLLLEDAYGELLNAYVPTSAGATDLERKLSDVASRAKRQGWQWGTFWAMKEHFDDIRPCHALTAHRAQGSTYDYAFVHAGDIALNRNLEEALEALYVGTTRARFGCYIRER